MMRILVWNIQFFTDARITEQPGADPALAAANAYSAWKTLDYIISTVDNANPDVFVIVEPRCDQGAVGHLAGGSGPAGLFSILLELREHLHAAWCLVPPLRLNPRDIFATATYTETVGVFWRSDLWDFTGPLQAPGGYPWPWNYASARLDDRDANLQGTLAAAQCMYFNGGAQVLFPTDDHRRPYLTTFTKSDGTQRVRLFTVHTQPGPNASIAVARLTDIAGADWEPRQHNEVTVFAGDFNLNLADLEPHEIEALRVGRWAGLKVVPAWNWPAYIPNSVVRPRAEATPGSYLSEKLLDFALVRYGPPGAPYPEWEMVVADRVAGADARVAGLPNFSSRMSTPLHLMQAPAMWLQEALRRNNVVFYTTPEPHALVEGDTVTVSGVIDPNFNGTFEVSVLTPWIFYQAQSGPNVTAFGGYVILEGIVNRLFREIDNFGHMGPPAHGVGTSDHLPFFFIV